MEVQEGIPRHLAVIMDGNGRWAAKRGQPPLFGHRAGVDALDRTMQYCKDVGIRFLTVYAFSTENWSRSKEEVGGLMSLLSFYIKNKRKNLIKDGIRFRVIGRRADLSESLQKEILSLEKATEKGEFTLLVALSYGGRAEIVDAVNSILKSGKSVSVTEADFAQHLYAPDVPDPDLIIRTSGECRVSNFLLWQSAYSEYYFAPELWPDFNREVFDRALESFSSRKRRMGGR